MFWPKLTRQKRNFSLLALLGVFAMVGTGCSKPEPIVEYKIPTKLPEQLKPEKDRMLASIVPLGEKAWFFKVTGPENAIGSIEPDFQDFVKSIQFATGKPVLKKLPEGWRRGGEKVMRYASIDVTTESKQLDISISNLGWSVGEKDAWDKYVAMNINRWRGQLGLDPSDEHWAGAEPIQVASSDGESVWFDMLGDSSGGGSMSPPFARNAPFESAAPKEKPDAGTSSADTPKSRLKMDPPEGWRKGKMSMMRWAAFNVGPEESQAEVTVMPAGGDLRGNVARWIGQVRGESPSDAIVDKALSDAQKMTVSDRPAQRFMLVGKDPQSGKAIDATIVPMEGGVNMFIKMTGPVETVNDQSEAMASFLKSLKF